MEGQPHSASVAADEPRPLDAAALQAERRLTWVRLLATAFSSCIFPFLATADAPPSARWAGYALLAAGWIQSLAALTYEPVLRRSARVTARIGIAAESGFTLLWVYATGGVESPWFVALYGAIVWVSIHRRPRDTLLSALICGGGYLAMAILLGQLAGHGLVVGVRVLYMFVIATSAAVISRERLTRLTSRVELLDLTQKVGQIGTWEWSIAANTITWSEELHRLFGAPRSFSPTFESYVAAVHPDDRAHTTAIIQQTLADGKPFRFDHRIVTADGTVRSLHCRGRLVTDAHGIATDMVGSAQDVTERKKMEAQLVMAGKLASLGTLASGVAHEINNPLAYVASNLELIERQLQQLEPGGGAGGAATVKSLREAVSAARHGSARMRDIVQGLKTFSRPDEESKQLIDLARVADLAIEVASHQITQRARLVRDFAPTPRVLANESRLAQVFMNLLVNAAQAIERGTVDENVICVRIYEASDGSACVEVSDSGSGVASDHLERIFDPFFTTKATGDGTGLGLSICHGIVRELGGEIRVTETSAAGTTFRVSLPLAAARSKPEPEEERTVSGPVSRVGPTRRKICIIDDEERYARSLRLLLEDEHEVTLSPSAAHASALIEEGADFDVILCDLMMPGKTGMDLYDDMAKGGCDVRDRIVFVTGGPTSERARAFLARPGIRHAEKPLELERLQALIEEVATRSRSAA